MVPKFVKNLPRLLWWHMWLVNLLDLDNFSVFSTCLVLDLSLGPFFCRIYIQIGCLESLICWPSVVLKWNHSLTSYKLGYLFYFFFLLCHVACGFFVLHPGNKCTWIHALLVKVWSPNHWTARKVPRLFQDWEFQHYYLIKAITLFSVLHSLAFTYTHTYVEFQIKVRLKKWDSCIRGIVYFLIIKAS